ncbi:zinc finger protein DHHC domain containing protein, putative, partial [Perkinsus marinus ATCC 50983]
ASPSFTPFQVCVICRVTHTLRSRHCKECRRCVDRLDHHCPWIDNCVGIRNQRSFYLFLLVLSVGLTIAYYLVFRFIST